MSKEVTTLKIAKALLVSALLAAPAFGYAASEIKHASPKAAYPAQNQEIPSCEGVKEIYINIPGGGEIGIEKIIRSASPITIELNGNPYLTVSASDQTALTFSPRSVNEIAIHTDLTEPGTYTVNIPADLVQMAIDSGTVTSTSDDEEPPVYFNNEYSYSFTIVPMPAFSISPKPGLYKPADVAKFTFTLPEGAEVSAGAAAGSIGLMVYDLYEGTTKRVTTFNPSFNGNVVTLTAANPSQITALSASISRQWYYVVIPKNALVIKLDGETYSNPALEFEKYDVRVVGAEGFSISPSPAEGLLPMDVREFTISYPAKYNLDKTVDVGTVVAYLSQTGNTAESSMKYSGIQFGNLKVVEIDEENHTLKLRMADPKFSFAYENNPDLMETSYYCVSFTSRVFIGLSVLNFPGYHVTGKDGCSLAGISVIVDGEAQDELELEYGQSFNSFDVFYPFNVKKSGKTADITVTKDGEVVGTLSSSAVNLPASGDVYMSFTFRKVFRAKGEYILTIPAGIFTQTSFGNYSNLEQKIRITIGVPENENPDVSGVDEIGIEEENAQAVYYTLDGRTVNAGQLAPGLYIVRKGKEVNKILVK